MVEAAPARITYCNRTALRVNLAAHSNLPTCSRWRDCAGRAPAFGSAFHHRPPAVRSATDRFFALLHYRRHRPTRGARRHAAPQQSTSSRRPSRRTRFPLRVQRWRIHSASESGPPKNVSALSPRHALACMRCNAEPLHEVAPRFHCRVCLFFLGHPRCEISARQITVRSVIGKPSVCDGWIGARA